MEANILQPGFLVAMKTSVRGGVNYTRTDLPVEGEVDNAKRWETVRVIEKPEEHESAIKARAKASAEIRKVCSQTSFGLLCPKRYENELDNAITRAADIVEQHNRDASSTRIAIYVLKGRIAETDEEATRAIASEVSDLLTNMSGAIDKLDAEAVRESANRARKVMDLLGEEQQEMVGKAISEARKAARAIVARIEKKGEAAATVLADLNRSSLNDARIAFLDMSEHPLVDPEGAHMPAVDLNRVAGIGEEVW